MQGGDAIEIATKRASEALLKAGYSDIDYVSVADAENLELAHKGKVSKPMRLLIAAHCDGVRLIDNCAV